ncbi:hypothetical protein DVJ83_18830 (plasmid) [Deinococcus wulumuqiensis]|uniref:Uncharacterized protein n=1 Tax=Deinococcus wulumuqiensis TaxID=980427 RepID=A0A345INC1_9DEIO|nr:hypothetical protein DVJ83_18830 [Deinococcus wulumuqiensis]
MRQFAREQWLAQGLCRLFIGEGYVRPVPDPGGSGTRSGSGARRTRQKNEVRPGHYDKQGVMVFGPVTLTRKGLKVLEDSCEN